MTKLTQNQIITLEAIRVNGKTSINDKDVCYRFNLNPRTFKTTVNSLVKKGLLIETKERFNDFKNGQFESSYFYFVEISAAGLSIIDETKKAEETQAEETQAPAKKLPKKLSPSTIRKYSVLQIAKHADRYQDKIGIQIYRFDFAYGTVYEMAGKNSYVPFLSLYESSYNRMMIIELLESIYEAAK